MFVKNERDLTHFFNRNDRCNTDIFIDINNSYDNKNTFWKLANIVECDLHKYSSSCVIKATEIPVSVIGYTEDIIFDCYFIYDEYGPNLYIILSNTTDIYEMKNI
jgi:hypothetical protein